MPTVTPAGESARQPASDRDRFLNAGATDWMLKLPRSVMPFELASTYPRICNRLALLWPDHFLTQSYFDSLLIDQRGQRQGFPPRVATELITLHEYYERAWAPRSDDQPWDDRSMAVGDR